MENPLISVLVPIYNIEPYLRKCIDSIIGQTYTNLEIILVDDGSVDECGTICELYAEQDQRISVIHKKNEGLVAARKSGLAIAKGEYILNVDGDDWIESDMVERLLSALIQTGSDVAQTGYIEEGGKGKKQIYDFVVEKIDSSSRTRLVESWMEKKPIVDNQIFTKLMQKEIFQKAYECVPDDMSYGEDCIFLTYLILQDIQIIMVDSCLYHYRIREGSLSHTVYDVNWLLKEDGLTQYLSSLFQKRFPAMNRDIFETWVVNRKLHAMKLLTKKYDVVAGLYHFNNPELLVGKKIIVYGAGMVGSDYILQLSRYEGIQIVAWVDKEYQNYHYKYREVQPVSALLQLKFDYIVIAVLDERVQQLIKDDLISKYHIDETKIVSNVIGK